MFRNHAVRFLMAAAAVPLVLSMVACGDDEDSQDPTPTAAPTTAAAMAAEPFGPACSAVPASGPGSFDGMAADPVATAASNNPVLSTLVTAVTMAGLGDTLNNAKDITVFAPVNDAFAKIPQADLTAVLADKDKLTSILTYHVVGQKITPEQLGTAGPFTTLQGGEVAVTGSGTDFTVGGTAKVVCGNVQTANATVYIIDTVLMPA